MGRPPAFPGNDYMEALVGVSKPATTISIESSRSYSTVLWPRKKLGMNMLLPKEFSS
jgi:hypothetical protein